MFDEIKFRIEDWKTFYPLQFWGVIFGALIAVILALYFSLRVPVGYDEAGNPKENSNAQITQLEKDSTELKDSFSVLSEMNMATDDKYPVLDISLYLKDPFIKTTDLELLLKRYINALQVKYNNTSKKTYVVGIKISLYDRKLVYDKGLAPRGIFYYMLNKTNVLEQADKEGDTGADDVQNVNTFIWQKTVEQTKKPDYNKYSLTMEGFQEYTETSNALSDEEFAFFLKLKLYGAVAGSDVAGIRLYLTWDLGAKLNVSGEGLIIDELIEFMDRQKKTGDRTVYYDYPDDVKQKLAVQRPQFLLYALNKTVVLERLEAQKELIKLDRDLYQGVIEKDVEARSNALNKDGTSNYKESTEFDATIGTMKVEEEKSSVGSGTRKRQIEGLEDVGIDSSKTEDSTNSAKEDSVKEDSEDDAKEDANN